MDSKVQKISIIMATRNVVSTLNRATHSVFNQTYSNVELLVADAGSVDGTAELLAACEDSRLTWWVSEPDTGIYNAWNKALQHISGDWVLFLGGDDELWDNNVIERFVDGLHCLQSKCEILYGQVGHVNSSGKIWEFGGGRPWSDTSFSFKMKGQMLAHQGVFHSARIFKRGELFDESYGIAGDYELLLRVLKDKDAEFIPDLIVAKMWYGGLSGGFNNVKLHKEFMRARRMNGYPETWWTVMLRFRYMVRSLVIFLFGYERALRVNNVMRRLVGKYNLPS